MIKESKYREKQLSFHVTSLGHHDSAARSDICYQLQNEVNNLKRQDQKNRIDKENKNQDYSERIDAIREMEDQRDGFSKGGQSISKWSQYHWIDSICILQCQHNCSRLQVGTRFSFAKQKSKISHRKSKT